MYQRMVLLSSLLLWGALSLAEPPKYVPAKAYHILPETTSEESGYFSLCEGLDGNMYVGAAKYGQNSYLVEFDPRTEEQRIVIDTHKVCGLSATGYAAQAKIHTRNFVGPSAVIYVGSKQGYRKGKDDTADYPGGYVMSYDPRTGQASNLGMPFPTQGVIDVVADEGRGLLYVVTCEDQHWMLGDIKGGKYRELGPMLTPYATTLIDAGGKAHVLTKDFQLATYDPATGAVATRAVLVDGEPFVHRSGNDIPIWVLSADQRRAYLILMDDPTLLEIDLMGGGEAATAISHGVMVEGKHPDSRGSLTLSPDGNVYSLVRIDNETGFGTGYLHHLARFDPRTKRMEDLGVLAVSNPDFFPFDKKPPHSHGFHRLPDGTLTPLHVHMALAAAHDGTLYATIIYPFTLLRIEGYKLPARANWPVRQSLANSLAACDRVEQIVPKISEISQKIAKRHEAGGMIGSPFESQAMVQELWGRSGAMMNIGFGRGWKKNRSEEEKANDVALVGYDHSPGQGDVAAIAKLRERGCYIVGIGPGSSGEITAACDVWIDIGAVSGRQATLANALAGWSVMMETIAALTRDGHMPPIWKSYAYADAKEWTERYFGKVQFHDDLHVPPMAPGELARRYLGQIRAALRRIEQTEADKLELAAARVSQEAAAGRKVIVTWQGHMPPMYIGQFGDSWAVAAECHPFLPQQVEHYRKTTPDGALVLSLGYHGLDPIEAKLWQEKHQHVIHLCGDHPDPPWRDFTGTLDRIDLGFAFGDACVTIDGYPLRVGAPSGVLQLAAYDAILAGVTN
jgi:hypothetical protein